MARPCATVVARRRSAQRVLIAGVCGMFGCAELNPSWDGPASTGATASTGEATQSSGTSADPSADGTVGSASHAGSSGDATATEPVDVTATSDETGPVISQCEAELPPEGACPEACNSCDDGVCVLRCVNEMDCPPTVACPDGWPCRIACVGPRACRSTMLVCPAGHACEIECNGDHSCENAKVSCGDGPCSLHCDGHREACKGTEFRCGGGDGEVSCGLAQAMAPKLVADPESSCACILNAC
jgi:hypothetical protein